MSDKLAYTFYPEPPEGVDFFTHPVDLYSTFEAAKQAAEEWLDAPVVIYEVVLRNPRKFEFRFTEVR